MKLSKAIKLHCLDCCCDSQKEVTLCPAFGCALWPFRTNESPGEYGRRMEAARRNYAPEIADMAKAGVDTAHFFAPRDPLRARPRSGRQPQPPRKGPALRPQSPHSATHERNSGGAGHPSRGPGPGILERHQPAKRREILKPEGERP